MPGGIDFATPTAPQKRHDLIFRQYGTIGQKAIIIGQKAIIIGQKVIIIGQKVIVHLSGHTSCEPRVKRVFITSLQVLIMSLYVLIRAHIPILSLCLTLLTPPGTL